jgi:VIT1/CCC1 family predicted Fe2+/Mn2+ transporter
MTHHLVLQEHSVHKRKVSPISEYLKEIIYGGNDGIVTTFAVVAGFTGAQSSISGSPFPLLTVLLFGSANLFADGLSMGLGNFISLRSEKDLYQSEKKQELSDIANQPGVEKTRTIGLLQERGFNKKQATELTNLYSQNRDYWAEFMMKYELEIPDPQNENPYLTAFATFFSFIFFGFIPLVPYVFLRGADNLFFISSLFTLGALILLGLLRWKVTKDPLTRALGEIVVVGSIAAVMAYFVGTFFRAS